MASLYRQYLKACEQRDKARDEVYAAAHPSRDVPFSECLAMASEPVCEAHRKADYRVGEIARTAIEDGQAWQGQFGLLHWYRHPTL